MSIMDLSLTDIEVLSWTGLFYCHISIYGGVKRCIQHLTRSEKWQQQEPTKEFRSGKELYADSYTPVEMMRILHKASHHCYLLESASQNEVWGRYSFLGYDPSMEITCTDGTLRIRRTKEAMETGENGTDNSVEEIRQVTHPGDAIREIIEKYKSPVMENILSIHGRTGGIFFLRLH